MRPKIHFVVSLLILSIALLSQACGPDDKARFIAALERIPDAISALVDVSDSDKKKAECALGAVTPVLRNWDGKDTDKYQLVVEAWQGAESSGCMDFASPKVRGLFSFAAAVLGIPKSTAPTIRGIAAIGGAKAMPAKPPEIKESDVKQLERMVKDLEKKP